MSVSRRVLPRFLSFALWMIAAGCVIPGRLLAEESHRYGIFVGQNDGGQGAHRLLYAEADAERVRDLLTRVGSVDSRYATLLRGPRREQVLAAIAGLRPTIQHDREAGVRSILYFYYSGHADTNGLRLGATRLGLEDLKKALKDLHPDLRLVLLDACQSGEAARTKGGTRAPSFLVQVDDGDDLNGEVIITSSASDEASQESDRIGGGYFTHHLVSGLLGAADASRDGQVTLDEAYAYAYHRTLFETAGSSGGIQHPGYLSDLHGHGTLVLTRPDQGQTVLVFPGDLDGHYLVFDRNRKQFVAELFLNGQDERRLSLPAGRYLIQKRETDHLLTAEVVLTRGVMKQIDARDMTRSSFAQDFSRGVTESNVWRATRAPLYFNALLGVQVFTNQPPGPALFPTMPLVGFQLEWRDLIARGWSLGVDLEASARNEVSSFEAYDVYMNYREYLGGVALTHGKSFGPLRLSVGPRLSGLYIRREFPGGSQPFQDFATLTPGLVGEVGLEVARKLTLGLTLRENYLYYYVDGDNRSLGYGDLLLRASIRF